MTDNLKDLFNKVSDGIHNSISRIAGRNIMNENAVIALELIGGILLLFWPGGSVNLVFRLLGIAFIVYGGIRLYRYYKEKDLQEGNQLKLIGDVILCLLGLSFLVNPGWLMNSASFLFGLIILLYGLYMLYIAKDAMPENRTGKEVRIGMISPVLVVILGLVLIIFPGLVVDFGLRIVGIALILTGVNRFYSNYSGGKNIF